MSYSQADSSAGDSGNRQNALTFSISQEDNVTA